MSFAQHIVIGRNSVGMNQQQLQQILTVAAVVAPMIQNSQGAANQVPAPAVNPQPVVNQQNAGNLILCVSSCFILTNGSATAETVCDADVGAHSLSII